MNMSKTLKVSKAVLLSLVLSLSVAASTNSQPLEPQQTVNIPTYENRPFEGAHLSHTQQEHRDPEANLPYLYAVFSITWAAFFLYLFFISRRQREMRQEIEELKKALKEEEKDDRESGSPTNIP